MVGLCFSTFTRFLLSLRFTGGGAPIAARAMAFTALVARNGLGFFFFGTETNLTTEDTEEHREAQKSSIKCLWLLHFCASALGINS